MSSTTFNQALGFFTRPRFVTFAKRQAAPQIAQPETLWQAFNRENKLTAAGETRWFVAVATIAATVIGFGLSAMAHYSAAGL